MTPKRTGAAPYGGGVNDTTVQAVVSFFAFPALVLGIWWVVGRSRRGR
jgi:hypothetical protein